MHTPTIRLFAAQHFHKMTDNSHVAFLADEGYGMAAVTGAKSESRRRIVWLGCLGGEQGFIKAYRNSLKRHSWLILISNGPAR